ncbi:hypothetical protein NQ314_018755 [Rhamnusium bicolor]|uniref:C2H2-type domain-containing protein n=1 Tax=Rhamnusium bicolor TaxID=1586634 RepID=A0AAV8WSE2_9CUCU|nr:hypothetical protein NQ314_018755 [Rhamnusium bicolor]
MYNTHDSKNEYICHVCNKNCKSLEGMREHLSYVREQFNCESCHTTYLNYEMCPFSVKKCSFCKEFVHSEITHFKCTICFKNFLSGDELRKHSFNPYEAYYCKFCFEYFDGDHTCPGKYKRCAFCKKSCLKMKTYPGAHPCFHTHTKNDLEMLRNAEFTECDVCGETFPKFNFKSHRRTHTHTFKCEICDAAYKTEKFFCQHVRCTHSDEPLNCTACGKILNNYNDYMIHKKKEHPKNKRSICYICGKEIATIYMSSHFQAVHCKELKHKCEHCGKAFTTMQRLTRHRLVHSNEFKHKCPMCGKGFKLPFSLKVHKRSHDEVKPFQCIVCLKTFTTKQWRNNHQKTHKSDIK